MKHDLVVYFFFTQSSHITKSTLATFSAYYQSVLENAKHFMPSACGLDMYIDYLIEITLQLRFVLLQNIFAYRKSSLTGLGDVRSLSLIRVLYLEPPATLSNLSIPYAMFWEKATQKIVQ